MTSRTLAQGIVDRIAQLAQHSEEPGVVTRRYLSDAHRRAADLLSGWMRQAGMATRLDAVGSVRGRYEAERPDAPTLLIGSHIDSVRDAGHFDGNLGVLMGVAAAQHFRDAGRRLPFSLEVVGFGDEEGSRFPTTLSGSRAIAGHYDPAILEEQDKAGITRRDALTAFGCDIGAISREACDPRKTLAYLEVHIEQGPVLEAQNLPVGVVTGINGARRGRVTVEGAAAHAGTTPMNLRRDALAAAVEMIATVERVARGTPDLVATVGQLDLHPGAVNTVPGRVTFSLDIRSPRDHDRDAAVSALRSEFSHIARTREVTADFTFHHSAAAAPCDQRLIDALAGCVRHAGIKPHLLPSGAGHDAMAFHGVIPFGMLFVRSAGGVSHHSAEFTSLEDIEIAAKVLIGFLESFEPASFSRPR